jgi:hypothetical protein
MTTTKTSKKTMKSKAKTTKTNPEPKEGAIDAQNASQAHVGEPEGTSATTPAATDGKKPRAKKERAPKEDLVVFAFRLTPAERDQIHKAAGPAKASKYVRALTRAASAGDLELVTKIVEAVKQELAS